MQNSLGTMTADRGGSGSDGGVLLHRDSEIAVIAQCWEALRAGQPSVVLIKGGRGTGKTALLDRALSMLPQPAMVLRARCTIAENSFPLGVVGQLFNHLHDVTPVPAGSAAHDVMQGLFQTTKSLTAGSPVVIAIDDLHLADSQSLQWFSYITRRLDDLPVTVIATVGTHTLTPDGALPTTALHTTADSADGIPGLMVQPGFSGSSGLSGFSGLSGQDAPQLTTTLHPGPLCDSCTEELAGHLLDGPLDPELSAACFTISQGNPLILKDFLRRIRQAGVHPGSPDLDLVLELGTATLAETSLDWLQQSDPTAADLLAGLAVLGPAADPAVAAILVGQGEYVAGQSWESLIRAGLVDLGPPATFANPLLGPAALSRIDTTERLRMHARAAELLMRLGSSATEAAEHVLLVGGGGSDDAPGILRSAARAAAELGDWADAVRYLRRALAESSDPMITGELAAQLGAVELHHDLRSSLRYAVSLGSAVPDPVARAHSLMPLVGPLLVADAGAGARVFVETGAELSRSAALRASVGLPTLLSFGAMSLLLGHRTGIRRWMRDLPRPTADDFGWESEQRTTGIMLGSLAVVTAAGGKYRRSALRLAGRSAQSAGSAGSGSEGSGSAGSNSAGSSSAGFTGVGSGGTGSVSAGTGSAPFSNAPFDSAPFGSAPFDSAHSGSAPFGGTHSASAQSGGSGRAAGSGGASSGGGGLTGAALTYCWAGELAMAEELAGRMASTARSEHHQAELALALIIRADAALRRGRVVSGLNDAQEALRLSELTNARGLTCAASAIAALCLLEQGHLDEATSVLRPGSTAEGHPLVVAGTWYAQSVLALARGNADDALRLALEAGHRLASHGILTPAAVRWRAAAVAAYLALGTTEAALSMAAEDVSYSRRWGSSVTTGAALTTLSNCLTGPDRLTTAHEAVALLEGTEADLDRARAMAALAQAMRAEGSNSEAAQMQHRASELRNRCGAVRGPVTSPEGGTRSMARRVRLTTSETRVSDLVLQGMSNQEVADELCISRRTVDTHLNRIYRKLEIRSRSELAAALEQLP